MANIIVADDNKSNVDLIYGALASHGHDLKHANNEQSLFKLISSNIPDVIIMGVELKKEDGRKILFNLKLNPLYKQIPVILTSPFFHTTKEITKYGCNNFVSMPDECELLHDMIEKLLKIGSDAKTVLKVNQLSLN